MQNKLSLEDKAQVFFNRYIRLRDCIKATGDIYYGRCFTCRAITHYNAGDAGHFTQGKNSITRYFEDNCNLQCIPCNRGKGGNLIVYREKLVRLNGERWVEDLELLDQQLAFFMPDELEEIASYYSKLVSYILKNGHIPNWHKPRTSGLIPARELY